MLPSRGVVGSTMSQPSGLKFEILSTRALSREELKRWQTDVIPSPDVLVRYRLSVTDGFSLYSSGSLIDPLGYRVARKQGKLSWLWGKSGDNPHSASPGFENLWHGVEGTWILMPAGSAIEWEGATDWTDEAGESHAFAIYVRHSQEDKPIEVISDFYVVPPKKSAPK